MSNDGRSPLQILLADTIARSDRTRDHYDGLLRKKLATSGKPLWDIERGKVKRPSPKVLRAIEEVLDLPSEHLVDLVHPREERPVAKSDVQPTRSADAGDTVEIQRLDLSLSMGPGTVIDDYVDAEPVRFDPAFVRLITRAPYHRLKLVTGIGDSMYPTLNWGDTIMIDTTDTALAKQDGIYWISYYGAAGLKRLRTVAKGRVLVISDNPAVSDQEIDAEDLRIEGRAIWFARGL